MTRGKKWTVGIICLLFAAGLPAVVWYRMSVAKQVPAAGEIDYYYSRSGSGSVCVKYAIYQYEGDFIFVAHYFNCGDAYMETYPLDSVQKEKFLEAVKQCRPDKAAGSRALQGEGGYSEGKLLCAGGKQYPLKDFSLDTVGLVLRDMSDIDFVEDSSEELRVFSEEMAGLRDTYNDSENAVFFIGVEEFERMMYDQLTEQAGEKIETVDIIEAGEEDFLIEVMTGSGKALKATVTHMGFVRKIR